MINNKLVIKEEISERLDLFLTKHFKDFSRGEIAFFLRTEKILVNRKKVKPSYHLKINDVIEMNNLKNKQENTYKPCKKPIEVVFENSNFLIINKPVNLVSESFKIGVTNSLINRLAFYFQDQPEVIALPRCGLLNRLDFNTTGLLIVAKNMQYYVALSKLFKERKVVKLYIAICEGDFKTKHVKVDLPMSDARTTKHFYKIINAKPGFRRSLSEFTNLHSELNYSVLLCRLVTGLRHQLRCQLDYLKHPIINDEIYGNSTDEANFGQYLHSYVLKFNDPSTKKEWKFTAEPPKQFFKYINKQILDKIK